MSSLDDKIRQYEANKSSQNTIRAYSCDWTDFITWCKLNQKEYLPSTEHTIKSYLADSTSRLKISSLTRRLLIIRKKHESHGYKLNWEDIESVWNGIKRTHGTRQVGKSPLLIEDIREVCRLIDSEARGKQFYVSRLHKAIILLGFCGAFRRSELVALDVEDLSFDRDGLKVLIRKSKTDQSGQGRMIGVPYGSHSYTCPVRAVEDWLTISGMVSGPLFRTIYHKENTRRIHPTTIPRILKKYLIRIFINRGYLEWEAIEKAEKYSGHSLRAGFVTTAAKAGVPEHQIRKQTGHASSNMLQRYIREAELFKDNPASKIGL